MRQLRDLVLPTILTFGLLACGGKKAAGPEDPVVPAATGSSGGETATTGSQSGGNFLNNFPLHRIISGGVPMDGIPALTDPVFVGSAAADAGYLLDSDQVLGVSINGEAKAYPHNIGWWHEIVNDVIGEIPIVVTFCPLTGTGLVFEGTGDRSNDRLTMGVSGLLFNNNLIMYDRRDNLTLYPQMIHKGVDGPGTNETLTLLPVVETTWGYWKRLYPGTTVVSGNGPGSYGLNRYRLYPYGNYSSPATAPAYFVFPALDENPTSQLYSPKHLTLGVRFREHARAYPFPALGQRTAVVNDVVAARNILVVWYAREQLAVPFSRDHQGKTLTFEQVTSTDSAYPFMLKDRETGSTWNLKGQAVSGELENTRLRQVPAHNAFWFAWATFWHKTEVYRPSTPSG